MRPRPDSRGFTVIEIMIVVTLIGILATLAIPAYQAAELRTRGTAFVNDARVFAEAFTRYAQEHGQYPGSQGSRDRIPPGMQGYLSEEAWQRTTPLGGRYSWSNDQGRSRGINRGAARVGPSRGASRAQASESAIVVLQSNARMNDLRHIDAWMDDGDTNTGVIQVRRGGSQIFYMLEN